MPPQSADKLTPAESEAARLEQQRAIGSLETRHHLRFERVEQFLRLGDLLRSDLGSQPVDQFGGHADADVGAQQRLFTVTVEGQGAAEQQRHLRLYRPGLIRWRMLDHHVRLAQNGNGLPVLAAFHVQRAEGAQAARVAG